MASADLMDWAASSDLCVFPSKFEMDTFLMAMGEAMASGAIPIATAQRGMRHFGHRADLDDPAATGLAVPRSFRVDDPLLVADLHEGLLRMLELIRKDRPAWRSCASGRSKWAGGSPGELPRPASWPSSPRARPAPGPRTRPRRRTARSRA